MSAYNLGDWDSIPGLGRSPGEGNGNPLQCSCPPTPRKRGLKEIFDFLCGLDGKASAYSAGDLGSIPGWGRSLGEGNGNPLQYSCSTPPPLKKRELKEILLEKEMAIHSSTIVWKIPWTEEPGRLQSIGSQRVGHD